MNNFRRRTIIQTTPAALPFIITVEIASDGGSFTLPLISTGAYNFEADWGDLQTDQITAYNQTEVTHTYSTAGTYDITMTGTIEGWSFGVVNTSKDQIIDVKSWGSIFINNNNSAFAGCQNLIDFSATDAPNLSGDVEGFLFEANQFTGVNSNINDWDLSGVTSLSRFFMRTEFNSPLDNWDTSNVEDMEDMFRGDTQFNQDLSSFNISSLLAANNMLTNTNLSVSNYDSLLIGWESQAPNIQSNVVFGGRSQYTLGSAAETARNNLINTYNWSILDQGGI